MGKQMVVAILAMALFAMSGCVEGEQPSTKYVQPDGDYNPFDNEAEPDSIDEGEAGPDGNATEENATEESGPVVSLVADTTAGTIPFDATFTFEATDFDVANLTWTFDADGDGEPEAEGNTTNGTFTYTYTEEGSYAAMFTANDNVTEASVSVIIAATASGGASADPNAQLPAPEVFTGMTSATVLCSPNAQENGVRSDGYHDYDNGRLGGWSFKVTGDIAFRTSWWTGAEDSESGGQEGVVPAGRDNFGVCPVDPVVPLEEAYTLTMYHPQWTFE